MKKIHQILLALFVVFAVVFTSAAVDVQAIDVSEYFPLVVGMNWTYQNETDNFLKYYEVVGTKEYDAGRGYIMNSYFDSSRDSISFEVFGSNRVGIVSFELGYHNNTTQNHYASLLEPYIINIPTNPQVGTTAINVHDPSHSFISSVNLLLLFRAPFINFMVWNQNGRISAEPWVQTVEIVSLGEEVILPAGTFTDVIVTRERIISDPYVDDELNGYKWYARGVGLIGYGGMDGQIATKLVSFRTTPAPTLTPVNTLVPTLTPIPPTAVPVPPTPTPTNTPAPSPAPQREGTVIYENDIVGGNLDDNHITEIPGTFVNLTPAEISIVPAGDTQLSANTPLTQNYFLRLHAGEDSGSLLFFSKISIDSLIEPLYISPREEVRVTVRAKGDSTAKLFVAAIDLDIYGKPVPVIGRQEIDPSQEWEFFTASHQSRSGVVVPLIQVVGPGVVYIDRIEVRVVNKDTF